ncbi:type VII secretion target [Mycobacterium sp. Aquia_213]|uniref:type VII secretion target n=1 Tax=Mycobacterium sp. Aquia_213 TaxID=2991728 RepID=UPI00226F1636|nr:type VII secretion target [Mycobacterium sp. Aquia_213]WAC89314.1 type VII secretion target [Mycobacterium sp. Aquia_213]
MPDLIADATYLAALRGYLKEAGAYLKSGFAKSNNEDFHDKLLRTHGLTSRGGSTDMIAAIQANRNQVNEQLIKCLKACDEALENAGKAYRATDQAHHDALDKQLKPGN